MSTERSSGNSSRRRIWTDPVMLSSVLLVISGVAAALYFVGTDPDTAGLSNVWNTRVLATNRLEGDQDVLVFRRFYNADENRISLLTSTGSLLWEGPVVQSGEHNLQVRPVGDLFIVLDQDARKIFALRKVDGLEVWSASLLADLVQSSYVLMSECFFVFEGSVFTLTRDGNLVSRDVNSGKVRWEAAVADPRSSPVVVGSGSVVIRTYDSRKPDSSREYWLGLDVETGKKAFELESSCNGRMVDFSIYRDELFQVSGENGACIEAFSLVNGGSLWVRSYDVLVDRPGMKLVGNSTDLFLVFEDERIESVNRQTGERLVIKNRERDNRVFPLFATSTVLVVSREKTWDSGTVAMVGFAAPSGEELWEIDLDEANLEPLHLDVSSSWDYLLSGDRLFVIAEKESDGEIVVSNVSLRDRKVSTDSRQEGSDLTRIVVTGESFWFTYLSPDLDTIIVRSDLKTGLMTTIE